MTSLTTFESSKMTKISLGKFWVSLFIIDNHNIKVETIENMEDIFYEEEEYNSNTHLLYDSSLVAIPLISK